MSFTVTQTFERTTNKTPRATESIMFRLHDDDGELYVQGMASDDDSVLAALDRYQETLGCTQAKTAIGGKWVDLN